MSSYGYASTVFLKQITYFTGSQLERYFASRCIITPVSTTLEIWDLEMILEWDKTLGLIRCG